MSETVFNNSATHNNSATQHKVKPHLFNKLPSWLYVVSVIALFFYLSITPIKTTLASLSYYGVEAKLLNWRANNTAITAQDYNAAMQGSTQAIKFHPTFAFYHDIHSEVIQWGIYAGYEGDVTESFEQIEALYKQSLTLRPTWPNTWANRGQQLFYAKGANDKEAIQQALDYLKTAHQLGEHIPEVHIAWTDIGLRLVEIDFMQFLSVQQLVRSHIFKGLTHHKARNKIIELVYGFNKQALVCAWLKQEAKASDDKITSGMAFKRLKCN
ncbi:hypothetical protein [Alteromonas sp. D210916BOD_24]|uniref:hypothetical protein n=1 Tax=Alteromonas sp. D210916BOD_24 TaxID=3157618 RepID=UPI00399CAEFA